MVKAEILAAILQIQERRVREVLKRRYVDMQTFEQIAVGMNYGWRNIMKLHKRGLTEVEVILSERERSV